MPEVIDEAFTGLDDLCGASCKEPDERNAGQEIVYVCTKRPHDTVQEMHVDCDQMVGWWEAG